MRNVLFRGVNEETYLRVRLLCLGHGLNMPQMLEKMTNDWYENSKHKPDMEQIRKIKRWVKKYKPGGNHGD